MSEAKITQANLMGDAHVYYMTFGDDSLFSLDPVQKYIVYDNNGDGKITEGDQIESFSPVTSDVKNRAEELIAEFKQDLPEQIKRFRGCWDGNFYDNAFNDCVVDKNNDKIPDGLGFKTSSGTDVSISYAKEDLKDKCTLKNEYEDFFANSEDELLEIAKRENNVDKLFNCEKPEPRGVAQYFKKFNNPPEGLTCTIVDLTPSEKNELAAIGYVNDICDSIDVLGVCDSIDSVGDGVSSGASATASFFSSAGEYISEWWNSDDDDEYVYHDDSRQATMISHLKL